MSTFETIYVIGHTIGSFLLLMVQFFVVKNYVVPFVKKAYRFVVDDYEEFLLHSKYSVVSGRICSEECSPQ